MNNKFDYESSSFKKVITNDSKMHYYIKVNKKYIEVSESVYLICIRSYWSIKNHYRKEVEKNTRYYGSMDFATSFYFGKDYQSDLINKIYIEDLFNQAIDEINNLPEEYREIAICIFLKDMSIRETANLLNITKSTVHYKKLKIQEILKNKLKILDK